MASSTIAKEGAPHSIKSISSFFPPLPIATSLLAYLHQGHFLFCGLSGPRVDIMYLDLQQSHSTHTATGISILPSFNSL
ncbi:wsv467 [White spot syndrome virus]|uniref:Wsv467 n=3 Tax=White spot syndrome virus TaxID=342409 RepID=Q8VAF3_WSSVS|nr:wsv467 [Shrimp white spot syndrome virus]AFX59841.1 wsv467 [White spot syndrome virus]AAL33468.1 wsv467 [Shrimp white spot syndrome virus]AAL89394.1 WSSV526 [Shrimp white spot syndrome virus]AWQ60585.1 wsv467 [Shrimp white spot syndrome virus]AWQ61024.1 wsv467 [Shrimp white spot syndrome virus]